MNLIYKEQYFCINIKVFFKNDIRRENFDGKSN